MAAVSVLLQGRELLLTAPVRREQLLELVLAVAASVTELATILARGRVLLQSDPILGLELVQSFLGLLDDGSFCRSHRALRRRLEHGHAHAVFCRVLNRVPMLTLALEADLHQVVVEHAARFDLQVFVEVLGQGDPIRRRGPVILAAHRYVLF